MTTLYSVDGLPLSSVTAPLTDGARLVSTISTSSTSSFVKSIAVSVTSLPLRVTRLRLQAGERVATRSTRCPERFDTSNVQSSRMTEGGGPPPSGAESKSTGTAPMFTSVGFSGGPSVSSSTMRPLSDGPLATDSTRSA